MDFQARRQNGRGGLSYVAEGYNSDDEVYATDKCASASFWDLWGVVSRWEQRALEIQNFQSPDLGLGLWCLQAVNGEGKKDVEVLLLGLGKETNRSLGSGRDMGSKLEIQLLCL